jgi:hypothetical protein
MIIRVSQQPSRPGSIEALISALSGRVATLN